MGITLLARTPTGSHLTEQGRLIVGWAEDVLDAADRLEAGLRSIRSGVSHRLAIAASQTIAEHLVPHWLVELRGIEQASQRQASTGAGLAGPTLPDRRRAHRRQLHRGHRAGQGRQGAARLHRDPAPAGRPGDGAPARRRDARGRRARASVGAPPPAAVAGRDRRDAAGHAGGRQRHQGHADRPPGRAGPAAERADRDGARHERRGAVGDRGRRRPRRAQPAGRPRRPRARPAGRRRGRGPAADQAADRRLAPGPRPAAARGRAPAGGREGCRRRRVRRAWSCRTSRWCRGRRGGCRSSRRRTAARSPPGARR